MVNFHLHVSGPKIRALAALASGQYKPNSGIVVNGLQRDGLVQWKTVPGSVEGITLDEPFITERGRTVLELITADVDHYLAQLRAPKRGRS